MGRNLRPRPNTTRSIGDRVYVERLKTSVLVTVLNLSMILACCFAMTLVFRSSCSLTDFAWGLRVRGRRRLVCCAASTSGAKLIVLVDLVAGCFFVHLYQRRILVDGSEDPGRLSPAVVAGVADFAGVAVYQLELTYAAASGL